MHIQDAPDANHRDVQEAQQQAVRPAKSYEPAQQQSPPHRVTQMTDIPPLGVMPG